MQWTENLDGQELHVAVKGETVESCGTFLVLETSGCLYARLVHGHSIIMNVWFLGTIWMSV